MDQGLSRRRVVQLTLSTWAALLLPTGAAIAAYKKTTDRRVRSETKAHGLIFAAKKIDPEWRVGHAFIVWQREDDRQAMSVSDAIGFYPAGTKRVQAIFGPGAVKSDVQTNIDFALVALVNSDAYQAAEVVKAQWQKNGTYVLGWSDCVAHVDDIARAIGLNTPESTLAFPQDYVESLMNQNE